MATTKINLMLNRMLKSDDDEEKKEKYQQHDHEHGINLYLSPDIPRKILKQRSMYLPRLPSEPEYDGLPCLKRLV